MHTICRMALLMICAASHPLYGHILYLRGTPYERGLQQGKLLKDQIQHNIEVYIDQQEFEDNDRILAFQKQLPQLLNHVPQKYLEEIQGIADGSSLSFQKLLTLNLFPELFHCTGLTVTGEMTENASLYHVRILDYKIGKNLQESAVLMIVEPNEGIPYLNVSYAGFVGTVTGMNEQKIAIGEIGGQGYGSWNGMPMSFLLREVLERATNLEEAKQILSSTPRTCEYFYIVSDGKTNDSFAMLTTADHLQEIEPGTNYHIKDLCNTVSLEFNQPPESLILTGFSRPERYAVLQERLLQYRSKIDEKVLQEVIKPPIADEDNLHTVIFHPSTLRAWVAHAGPANEPAYTQPYTLYSLSQILALYRAPQQTPLAPLPEE